jgi:DNA polymerase III sliding clamp (beta) subunit (PCNA family)
LSRRVLPDIGGWGSGITVPSAAVKVIGKLIADKTAKRVTLRHTATLFSATTPAAAFVSKLIDGRYPDYERTIPKPSANIAAAQRAEMLQALERLAAIDGRLVQLSWSAGSPALRLTTADHTEDLDAEIAGTGRVVVAIDKLTALLTELAGKSVELDSTDVTTPLRLTTADDTGVSRVAAPLPGRDR